MEGLSRKESTLASAHGSDDENSQNIDKGLTSDLLESNEDNIENTHEEEEVPAPLNNSLNASKRDRPKELEELEEEGSSVGCINAKATAAFRELDPDLPCPKRPKKMNYRQRAHCNPLSDAYIAYPASADCVDWSLHFPAHFESPLSNNNGSQVNEKLHEKLLFLNTTDNPITYETTKIGNELNGRGDKCVNFLDIGCGFGGLLFFLGDQYPDKLSLGLEIREKVTCFVGEKIRSCRLEEKGKYTNIAVLRTNAMKFLSNYIRKDQIEKMFFCFPDPHFKKANWRRRIVTPQLLSLYSYHLKTDGLIYVATDVKDLFQWMERSFEVHPLFEKVPSHLAENDPAFKAISQVTDEGKKMRRNGQDIYSAIYRCIK